MSFPKTVMKLSNYLMVSYTIRFWEQHDLHVVITFRKAKEKLDPRFATDEELRDFIMEFKVRSPRYLA